MKRGKRYAEAAKTIDRTVLYDAPEAISLVKKAASANLMKQLKLISEPDVTDVTQISRSVVQLFCLMVQVRL